MFYEKPFNTHTGTSVFGESSELKHFLNMDDDNVVLYTWYLCLRYHPNKGKRAKNSLFSPDGLKCPANTVQKNYFLKQINSIN